MERVREVFRTCRPTEGSLVRVVSIRGVGLRESDDGAVLLADDGAVTVHGSVLRNVANDRLIETHGSRAVIEVPVSDTDAADAGLVCGGRATLLVSPIADLPHELTGWMVDAEPVVLACRADGVGNDLAVTTTEAAGSLETAELTEAVTAAARRLIRQGVSSSGEHEVEGIRFVLSAAIPTTRAIIVGGGPMAKAFAAQGELMGWQVEIVDDDPDTDVATAISFCEQATPADALLVLSHNPAIDSPVLAAGLDSAVGYIGAMGSRHTQAARAERLEAQGYTDRSRIHGPVGLDLGSRSPAETAVAMAAEFLAVRRGKPPASLATHDGPIHA